MIWLENIAKITQLERIYIYPVPHSVGDARYVLLDERVQKALHVTRPIYVLSSTNSNEKVWLEVSQHPAVEFHPIKVENSLRENATELLFVADKVFEHVKLPEHSHKNVCIFLKKGDTETHGSFIDTYGAMIWP